MRAKAKLKLLCKLLKKTKQLEVYTLKLNVDVLLPQIKDWNVVKLNLPTTRMKISLASIHHQIFIFQIYSFVVTKTKRVCCVTIFS